jgi:hypothetical protein
MEGKKNLLLTAVFRLAVRTASYEICAKFELPFFVSRLVLKSPFERKAANRYIQCKLAFNGNLY